MSHRPAELRSLEVHRAVARRIVEDPAVLERARSKVTSWQRSDQSLVSLDLAQRWLELIDGPRDELLELLVADTQEAIDLRQVTPFAGVIDPRERWRILREVG